MRWLFRIFFGLFALAGLAVAVLFLLPADRIAKLAADQFESATGRALAIGGDIRPTLWPELGISTGAVSVANAAWSENGPMLRADRLSIGVDMAALWGGDIRITRIEADAPRILLEAAADGRTNWDLAAPASSPDAAADPGATADLSGFSLDKAIITDARVTYLDHSSGSRTELGDLDAALHVPEFRGAADLQLSAAMNGQRLSLDMRVAEFAALLSGGAVPVIADAAVGGSKLGFDGLAGLQPFAVGGQIDADISDRSAIFGLAGLAAPDVPAGLGRRIGLGGDVTFDESGRITLRNGTIRLDQNVLGGAVDVLLADRPSVTADLTAGALDFTAATTGGAGAADEPEAGAATGWPRDPIDVGALQALDAQIKLAAESIDLGVAQLGRTRLLTTLDRGRAVTEIRELAAYGGAVGGSFVVNSRGGLSARANLKGNGLALQPLLQQMAGSDRLLAGGDVAVNLLAVGDDMAALMNSLSGEGSVKVGQGELRGLDLVGMLRNLDASYVGEGQKTIFDSISASFAVENGVLRNDDLKLTAPLLDATGKGTVGIGAQTLDYRLTAALLEGQTNGGLKIPVMVTGSWADPRFQLDLEALARQELADDVEELKTKAEEVVVDKLRDELGVEVDTLDDVEDVLKQELEERARKGLLEMLSGNN
ncbi:MAG: AsmA family protein [Rhodobacter sp.]|nr:AsmA family protein [Rhodobacter sp.]